MKRKPYTFLAGILALAAAAALGLATSLSQADPKGSRVPRYIVDPFWPKPLPVSVDANGATKPWVTGEVGGTCVDSKDHVFTVNRAFQNGLVAPASRSWRCG